jgi:sugar lactone lactonase YvrE
MSSLLPVSLIHQFSNPTWIENLAVRSNGGLLTTILTAPELYLVNPAKKSEPVLIHQFEGINGLLGIVEGMHDLFYVTGANLNLSTYASDSWAVWEVDMACFNESSKPSVKKIAAVPEAKFLNGFELLSKQKNIILMADSQAGAVWKLDVATGKHEVAIEVDEMKSPAGAIIPLGVNGIKVRDGYLYWTNSGAMTFCRVKIDSNGKAVGKVEIIATNILADDFTFDKTGNAWLVTAINNTVAVVKVGGDIVTVAGALDQLTVAGGTACHFGRNGDEHILYVTTTGGLAAPVNGTETEGGKIVAIDTRKFRQ